MTLFAQWGNLITFTSQGAEIGSPSLTSQGWSSGAINLPTVGTMVKTGYSFTGWSDGSHTFAAGASYTPTAGITFNPVWTANLYTVSYNANGATGGVVPANQSWSMGASAVQLSANTGSLVKSGYIFGGWSSSPTYTTPITSYSTPANQILYAIWSPISYTINYDLAGAVGATPVQASQRIFNTFTLPAAPTRVGYNFTGWNDGVSTYQAGYSYTITSNTPTTLNITAKWIAVFTVSYSLNGSTSTVPADRLYDSGTVISLATAPTRAGYTFAGWIDSANATYLGGDSFTVTQDSTIKARWQPISYTITYTLGGGSSTLPLQAPLTINSSFQVATNPIRAGYDFLGWSDGSSIFPGGSIYVVGSSPVTLTAQWNAITYAINFTLGEGVGAIPAQAGGTIGSTFSLPSSASNPTWKAHTFIGWSDGASLFQPGDTYTVGSSNVTFSAQYSLNGYTQISYSLTDVNGNLASGILPTQPSTLEGGYIVVASGAGISRTNYAFSGWSDGVNTYQPGDSYLVGPYTSPIIFRPSWTSGYNVSYTAGGGFGLPPVDPIGRTSGSTFTLASANTLIRQGFTFTGWSDGTNVYQPGSTYIVASSNITFTAGWVQNSLAGIAAGSLTPLGTVSIVTEVGNPANSFNFGDTTVTYTIPANALSAGTVISFYGVSDSATVNSLIPSDKKFSHQQLFLGLELTAQFKIRILQ